MKQTVDEHQFRRAFETIRPENFSYEGLRILFDHLEALEYDGEERELDVIELCCEYTEATAEEIAKNHSIDLSDCEDSDEELEKVQDYLSDHGAGFCGVTEEGTIVYPVF
tara:strand:- start:153 stop:482 length:330 start_codon:yes stop_codon:yes gene_type:complete